MRRKEFEGKPVGRQPGAVDKKPRRRSGYVGAWEGEQGERRRQTLAERNRQRALARHRGTDENGRRG